jgi:hypothetical protein
MYTPLHNTTHEPPDSGGRAHRPMKTKPGCLEPSRQQCVKTVNLPKPGFKPSIRAAAVGVHRDRRNTEGYP